MTRKQSGRAFAKFWCLLIFSCWASQKVMESSTDTGTDTTAPPCSTSRTMVASRVSICSLHGDVKVDDSVVILPFNSTSLAKCKAVLMTRKQHKLKHASSILPDEVDDIHGYHLECYRRFVALPKSRRQSICDKKPGSSVTLSPKQTTRSKSSWPKPCIRTGLFPKSCIFCDRSRKKVRGVEQKLVSAKTSKLEASIRRYMWWKRDKRLQARLQGVSFPVKEVKYHRTCRLKYQSDAEAIMRKENPTLLQKETSSSWHECRIAKKRSFEALAAQLQDTVIFKRKVYTLGHVNLLYQHLLDEYSDNVEVHSRSWELGERIRNHFQGRVKVKPIAGKRCSLVYHADMSEAEALCTLKVKQNDMPLKVRDVALFLRQQVKKAVKTSLPDDVKLDDLEKGEVLVPKVLRSFFDYLICGPDKRSWTSCSKQIRARSLSQDTVFSATSGRKKPGKHFMLGMALKSMTGSRKIIEILNKLGHCAHYHTLEELETEMTFVAARNGLATPYGMDINANCGTGVAWDNYDRFVETENGKNTLHDTVGIVYQATPSSVSATEHGNSNILTNDIELNQDIDFSLLNSGCGSSKKRRRTYEPHGLSIQPYRKKPRTSSSFLSLSDERHKKYETSSERFRDEQWKLDILWMSSFAVSHLGHTPMWAGWNCQLYDTDARSTTVQKVWYLPQINHSPTSEAVVAETMRRTLTISREAGRKSIAVTYDLAIAKKAMQIQEEQSPLFDEIFIALGGFHIELAFLSAMGKVVAESGGPEILNECNLIAGGSLKSFHQGKNYKRCKRMHEVLALSLEVLHFHSFLDTMENAPEILSAISAETEMHGLRAQKDFSISKEVEDILKEYDTFCQHTRGGEHGRTAQFWMQYIDFIHIYHDFIRSMRTGNLQLYISCLPKLTNCFFAMNHINYARWLVRYYDNMVKLPETHPQVFEDFDKGWFTIRRTTREFSSTPIDMVLEQTINADAASQRTGISSFTNSISARQRWAESHFLRTAIITKVLDEVNLTCKDDVSKHLSSFRITKDNMKIRKVTGMIKDSMNPFDTMNDKLHLYNIVTGKAVSNAAENFLLNIYNIGEVARQTFLKECIDDPGRFERRIKSQSISTFATDCGRRKLKASDGKLIEACLTRDVFGSLLCNAMEQAIDITEILKYPLSPVPLSLCHADGSMQKSPKSALMKDLEGRITSAPPPSVNVTIIDGAFFLHLHQNLPTTYGSIAKYLLKKIVEFDGQEIHFVSDKWVEPSIKGYERQLRGLSAAEVFTVMGPSQKRPNNWLTALRSASFKISLIHFLIEYWKGNSCEDILCDKVLFANDGDLCYKYFVVDGVMKSLEVSEYRCSHEEADTRMFFHLKQILPPRNVTVRTNDTDCLIVVLGCKHFYDDRLKIWLEVGVHSNNSQRYIDVSKLYARLGETLCKALPVYHALTGCDYTASFCRRGKVKPLKLLEKDFSTQQTFGAIGLCKITQSTIDVFEQFVCRMYCKRPLSSVDEVRSHMFFEKYGSKQGKKVLSFAKKLDPCNMPPCQKVLVQKIKRTCFVAKRWMAAVFADLPPCDPEQAGWRLVDDSYDILWFEGDPLPRVMGITCIIEESDQCTEVFEDLLLDSEQDSDTECSDEDLD